MTKHLVTGGSGFIGSALVKEILASGERVRVLDNYSRGDPRRLQEVTGDMEVLKGDVRDKESVSHALEGCDTVWHLAFINGTRFFYERPDDVLEIGIKGTLNVIEASLDAHIKRFVFVSTSETYQEPTHIPTKETERLIIPDITNPRFSYGGGKIAGELLTLHYALRRGMEAIVVRPHNVYGPDMGFEHVIPEIIARIFRESDGKHNVPITLRIQGTGDETRAFCYIDDAAKGLFIAGKFGGSGEVYHLGTQVETTVRELVEKIGGMLNIRLDIENSSIRKGGTTRRCPSIIKLSALGYNPVVTLEEGLRETTKWYWDWYNEHGIEAVCLD